MQHNYKTSNVFPSENEPSLAFFLPYNYTALSSGALHPAPHCNHEPFVGADSNNRHSIVVLFLQFLCSRRTNTHRACPEPPHDLQLGRDHSVPDAKIEVLVQQAILHVPSAFNTQSTRLVVMLHQEHERWWDIVIGVFQNLVKTGAVPERVWKNQTLPKLKGFKAAVGTILFYEDPAHIEPYSEKFSLYKDQFEPWAQHSNAMHQYFSLGFGANLQHYNPLIDMPVAEAWNVPKGWKLGAQLVFGSPEGSPGSKEQKPVEERVTIFGKS
ncbi:Nitroreductase [Aspergillus saccharolyticus JOP 1030-1]|uniref:Nitroreductase n=1 Tax=Aspergillus saccharolyticus JOP 1030-1 TaxID=1450539 RepID=A0A318Z316_9EURO|nr:Nitroreductase [Aspergillus saccharolyticus JOP 1030-1]PYH40764.1 Nitroreductase [Aspergillus saccharolyticus JOP 1030-1]